MGIPQLYVEVGNCSSPARRDFSKLLVFIPGPPRINSTPLNLFFRRWIYHLRSRIILTVINCYSGIFPDGRRYFVSFVDKIVI